MGLCSFLFDFSVWRQLVNYSRQHFSQFRLDRVWIHSQLPGYLLNSFLTQSLLNLIGADWLVFSGADPRIHEAPKSLLLERTDESAQSLALIAAAEYGKQMRDKRVL